MLASACSPLDGTYIREGIGTTLGTEDLVEASRLQDIYVGEICRQAGLRVSRHGDFLWCDEVGMRPSEWTTFVQAGLNDIDRRCDAYLGWVDNKRRWREPILKQLLTTSAATAAIMGLTGVGAAPIAIVGTAFGLAQDSFVNISSRLLTEIDHSVIQQVVLGNQNQFRIKLAGVPVDNRPAAIYLLRNYLRICMPFSIEMSINSTIATYHRAGPQGLAQEQPVLTQGPSIARATASVPLVPTVQIARPVRPKTALTSLADYKLIIAEYDPDVHSISKVEPALIKICVPEAELRAIGERAKLAIRVYQQAAGLPITGLLRTRDLVSLNGIPDCPLGRLNYFEANWKDAKDGLVSKTTIDLMNVALAKDRQLRPEATEFEVRSRIPELRVALSSKLQLKSPLLSNQITSDLIGELTRLQILKG
jgi:hypothetical protein